MAVELDATPRILLDQERLAALYPKWRAEKLALFGSVLCDEFCPDSDVGMLVQFQAGHTPGWEIVDVSDELADLLGGRKVDLVNPRYLDERLHRLVLNSAVVQYEAPHAA